MEPFIGTEALAAGEVTKRTLRSRHSSVYRNVYLPRGHELTAATRAMASWLWSGRTATAAGLSAAALLGTRWIDPRQPAELYRRNGKPVDGILIHRGELRADEVCTARGIPATTPTRTAFDLGRRKGLSSAVIYVDALANATKLRAVEVEALTKRHAGVRGLVQLRRVLQLMDGGAESPQESRTRLLLVRSGLPKPETQIVVLNQRGHPCARIDMGYREWKIGVEFDGAQHWTDPAQRTADIDRYSDLAASGWVVIRVSSDLLRYRPRVIVARVCAALRESGAGWPVIERFLTENVA